MDRSHDTNNRPAPALTPAPSRWRRALLRLTASLAGVALVLLVLEGVLLLCGAGYPTSFFVKSSDGKLYQSNRQFGWRFFPRETALIPNPVQFPAKKESGVVRIFLLGESAAEGSPDPSFGFGRILERMLWAQYPTKRFEMVNASMRGIHSHIVREIARECMRHSPDLLIVYMGNNEFVELHTGSSAAGQPFLNCPGLFRAVQWIRTRKISQSLEPIVAKLGLARPATDPFQDMDFFRGRRMLPDDPRRAGRAAVFHENLNALQTLARHEGVRLLLSTIPVNLRDCPPLGSLHRPGRTPQEAARWENLFAEGNRAEAAGDHAAALEAYEQAVGLDGTFAELHFRLARTQSAAGNLRSAAEHFSRARDLDALQFRADSRINDHIRRLGSSPGIHFVDMDQLLSEAPLGDEATGSGLFYDHVHFNFDGDYQAAKLLLSAVAEALGLGPPARGIPLKTECARWLAYTTWDEANAAEQMLKVTGLPPFLDRLDHEERQRKAEAKLKALRMQLEAQPVDVAIRIYESALKLRPDDWQLHYNFGYLLRYAGRFASAFSSYHRVLSLYPNHLPAKLGLGSGALEAGRVDEAVQHFAEAVQMDPHSKRAWRSLSQAVAAKAPKP